MMNKTNEQCCGCRARDIFIQTLQAELAQLRSIATPVTVTVTDKILTVDAFSDKEWGKAIAAMTEPKLGSAGSKAHRPNNPNAKTAVRDFLNVHVGYKNNGVLVKEEAYRAYQAWQSKHRPFMKTSVSRKTFYSIVREIYPSAVEFRPTTGERMRSWRNLSLVCATASKS